MAPMTAVVTLICVVVLACALRWPAITGWFMAAHRIGCHLARHLFRPCGGLSTASSSGRGLPAVGQQLIDAAVELGG